MANFHSKLRDVRRYVRDLTDVQELLNLIFDENPELLRAIALETARAIPETLENYYKMKPLPEREVVE